MPLESNPRLHLSPQQQRRPSRANSEHNLLTTVLQAHIMASSNLSDSSAIIDDNDATPTQTHHNSEPILNLAPPRQDTDDSSRSSFSLYQLGSALYDRALGAVSTASSVAGSETDGVSTLVSHLCLPALVPVLFFDLKLQDPLIQSFVIVPVLHPRKKNNSPFLTQSLSLI
jgi:hypothetical protein